MTLRRILLGAALAALMALAAAGPALAAPDEGDGVHFVARGENLTMIARRYGVSLWAIARANGITNPNRIYVGQRLLIPSSAPPAGRVHIVKRGETLAIIAWRYGVDRWAIARANGIANLNLIYIGQRLVIPGARAPRPAPKPLPPKPLPAKPAEPVAWLGPWIGEYFAGRSLTDPPVLVRPDERIAFDWGFDRPSGCVPADHFSVRWTGSFALEEGAYQFSAKVDDGIRVTVDDEIIIDGWENGSLRTYTALHDLAKGQHTIVVEYYDFAQVARVYFWIKRISGPSEDAEKEAPSSGWAAEFFNNEELAGDPVLTRVDPWIGFEWGAQGPAAGVWADHFSARWTNRLYLEQDHYRFCAMSDDGVRIWVDDEVIVDHWHANNGTAYCGVFYSTGATYPVKVEYFEDGGDALIYVWWEPH